MARYTLIYSSCFEAGKRPFSHPPRLIPIAYLSKILYNSLKRKKEMMMFKKKPFKIGASVRFKDGQKDEGSGIDIGGWQGRIIEIDKKHKLVQVALDSATLKSLSRDYLEECEEEGLG
ncbi:MAG: hypothetical protein GY796_33540 [Chloroflexi bacterium]|nr:hypothetical protein [Chloroflexota bacterium]